MVVMESRYKSGQEEARRRWRGRFNMAPRYVSDCFFSRTSGVADADADAGDRAGDRAGDGYASERRP